MGDTKHTVHFPDGEVAAISYHRLLQMGEAFSREGQEWRVTGVELRDDGWHVLVVEVVEA